MEDATAGSEARETYLLTAFEPANSPWLHAVYRLAERR
jgi:hypothetical protein